MYGGDQDRAAAGQPGGQGQCCGQAHLCKLPVYSANVSISLCHRDKIEVS